ncbi:MAG: hypothetical protein AVDCRST_MAG89-1665, partial [uncultured Gemmatimonadetes bacterium]
DQPHHGVLRRPSPADGGAVPDDGRHGLRLVAGHPQGRGPAAFHPHLPGGGRLPRRQRGGDRAAGGGAHRGAGGRARGAAEGGGAGGGWPGGAH